MKRSPDRICFDYLPGIGAKRNAGSKAPDDALHIVKDQCGYTILPFSCRGADFKIGVIRPALELHILKAMRRISGSIVFINFPFTLAVMLHYGFADLCKRNKVILLVHDIDSLRGIGDSKRELRLLSQASCLIVHNQVQADYLRKAGIKTPLVILNVFDYCLPEPYRKMQRRRFSKSVSFVGNLDKAPFISQWIEQEREYSIELIGNCTSDELKAKLKRVDSYKGAFMPAEVPYRIEGSFGLVWDGPSLESCAGKTGGYLRYNAPHKLSLYLVSGIPVIIWSQAAMADFIKQNKVGFLIDSISDITSLLTSITEEEYEAVLENIRPIQKRIRNGKNLEEAMFKAEKIISHSSDDHTTRA